MNTYTIWNNKGGVGKSYLTFQIACEYAKQHPNKKVLVVDLCPQANSSAMLLGGIVDGEKNLEQIHSQSSKVSISGYINERLVNPFKRTNTGNKYATKVTDYNKNIPENVHLVVGDEQLEIQASAISHQCQAPHVPEAWRIVHLWIRDLITEIVTAWNTDEYVVFIDCNPSFTIYTELALCASDRLIIPFTADGSSKRAVKSVLSLVYGYKRHIGDVSSYFYSQSDKYQFRLPKIYFYIGNRLPNTSKQSAKAFRTVVTEIGDEIYNIWQKDTSVFCIHPNGAGTPNNKNNFKKMFQYEIRDANSASVISSALGIPMSSLKPGTYDLLGREVMIIKKQVDEQAKNIQELVSMIE